MFGVEHLPHIGIGHSINEYLNLLGVVAGDADFHDSSVAWKGYLTYPYENGALLRCELAAGSFSVDGIATKSPQILFKSSDGGAAAA